MTKVIFAWLAIFCVLLQDPQHERVVVVVYLSVLVTCWLLGGPFSNTLPLLGDDMDTGMLILFLPATALLTLASASVVLWPFFLELFVI